jgi:hypothetical protein
MNTEKKTPGGFATGTMVHTKEGLRPIEAIRAGDWVLSWPDDQVPPQRLREQHEYTYRQVTGTSARDDAPVCVVTAWDLGNNIKEEIRVAPHHSVYVKGGGWTPAGAVKFGNGLVCSEFANLLVKKRFDVDERVRVHTIEVEGCCTYYVGELGVWVHEG